MLIQGLARSSSVPAIFAIFRFPTYWAHSKRGYLTPEARFAPLTEPVRPAAGRLRVTQIVLVAGLEKN